MARLCTNNKRNIYVSYKIGDINGKSMYEEPVSIVAQVGNMRGATNVENYGKESDYDRLVYLEYNNNTLYIDEHSKIWIDVKPINSESLPDYEIVRCGDVINLVFTLYLKSIGRSLKELWFEYKNKIYSAKVDFYNNEMKAVIPANMWLPIQLETTPVWYRNPNNDNTSSLGKMKLVSKTKENNSYILIFDKIGE